MKKREKKPRKKWVGSLLRMRFSIILLLVVQLAVIIYVLFSGSTVSEIISYTLSIISFFVCLYIVSKRDKGAYKLTWVFLILLFPLFGGLFYLFFRFQSPTRRFSKRVSAVQEKARPFLSLAGSGYNEACSVAKEHTSQIKYLENYAGFPIYTDSETKYLPSGEKMNEALLEELKAAKRYIFLEYFIVEEGVMWDSILEILEEKVQNGVKVRLIYDDFGCFFKLPKNYAESLRAKGIECVVFNRFRPVLTAVQNNRDHRKISVIDGKVAFTGGINLADEYINAIERFGHWKDSAVMIRGRAAWSFTLMFLQMWEVCTGIDEDYGSYYPWEDRPCSEMSDGFVQPYADSPLDEENTGEHVYLQMINSAKDYLYITTPYLVIDDSMISALCLAAKSGVDVRIITPGISDSRWVHATTRSYYGALIGAGVKIYEYTRGFMHAKTFVSDDTTATVGTTNLDFRSLYLHFECGVWMYGSGAVAEVKNDFEKTVSGCHRITAEECRCGPLLRLFRNIMRLFAPLV